MPYNPMRRALMGACLALTSPLLASCLGLDSPASPDMSPLVAAYDNPDATLDSESLKELVDRATQALSTAQDLGDLASVTSIIDAAANTALNNGKASDGSGNSALRSVIRIHHVCPGDAQEPTRDPAVGGRLDITLKANVRGLEPVIWGNFVDCRMRVGGKPVRLDGKVEIFDQRAQDSRTTVFSFNGEIETQSGSSTGAYDFRVFVGIQQEVRVGLNGESFVVGIDRESKELLVRDSRGEWRCSPSALRCHLENSDEVIEAAP